MNDFEILTLSGVVVFAIVMCGLIYVMTRGDQ